MANLERSSGIGIDDEVGVSLTESRVYIRETVPLVGHRTQCFCQQLHLGGLDRQLAFAGGHDRALSANPVAEVQRRNAIECGVTHHGLTDEELNLVRAITHSEEHQLALIAFEHHSTGDGHHLGGFGAGFERAVRGANFSERVRAIEAVGVGVHPVGAQFGNLGQTPFTKGFEVRAVGVRGKVRAVGFRGNVVAHEITTSTSPEPTLSPAFTFTALTVPALSACNWFSIFMASRTTTASPALTS